MAAFLRWPEFCRAPTMSDNNFQQPRSLPQFQRVSVDCLAIGPSQPNPPIQSLYVRGTFDPGTADTCRISIVGSRDASPAAMHWTQAIARSCSRRGFIVVSGGARGIDSAAHVGALLQGGVTWWVAGTSIDRIYPACHKGLFRDVVAHGGAMISEVGPQVNSGKYMFRLRNRIIAALGDALLVVAAGAQSGTLSTVEYARSMGKPIFVPPRNEVPETAGVEMLRGSQGIRTYRGENVLTELSKCRARCIGPESLRGKVSSTTSAK